MKISEKGNLSKTYQGKYVADKATLESIEKHLDATAGNPHKVTASDVGAYNKDEVDSIVSGKANIDDVYTKDIIDYEFQKVEIAWDTLSKNKAGKNTVYTKEEVDSKIDVISSEVGNRYTKEEVDNKLSEIGGSVDAYTKAEIDEKLKNPSYEEQVKLTGITTAVPGWDDAGIYISDNSIGSASAEFTIDVQGDVKFNTSCVGEPEHTADFYIDGKMVAQCHDGASFDFEGHVSQNIRVHCSFMDVYFLEFTKKVYVKDAVGDINGKIGNIDVALDELHTYAQALIGGEA